MAVTFDAVGPSSAGVKSLASTTLSWTHTNVGSAVALVVSVAAGIANHGGDAITAKLDPAGANTTIPTLGALMPSGGLTAGFVQLFGLPDVSAGAHIITLTYTGGTPEVLNGGSVSYAGAHLTAPFGTQQTSSQVNTANPSIVHTGTTSDSMVSAGIARGGTISSVSAGTSRWISNDNSNTAGGNGAQADIAGSGGSVTITWTSAAEWSGIASVEILAAPSGPPPEGPHNSEAMHLMGKSYY